MTRRFLAGLAVLCLPLILARPVFALQIPPICRVSYKETKDGHLYEVRASKKIFRRDAHILKPRDQQGGYDIDDLADYYGLDGHVIFPSDTFSEFDSFRFFVDGKEIAVPKNLYRDCFDPALALNFFRVRVMENGTVFVLMNGGSAAGSYNAFWALRTDGKHSRWVGMTFGLPIGSETDEQKRYSFAPCPQSK